MLIYQVKVLRWDTLRIEAEDRAHAIELAHKRPDVLQVMREKIKCEGRANGQLLQDDK